MRQLTWAASAAGEDKLAHEFADLLPKARSIVENYFLVRGRSDADEIAEVLLVESEIVVPLVDGLQYRGIVDLVTRDHHGLVTLWDHKSSLSVPSASRGVRDLQTVLYRVALTLANPEYRIDAICWNYLRTRLPDEPEVLKRGAISRKKIDTTWPVYRAALLRADQNLDDYADMYAHLKDAEHTRFFVRHVLPIMQDDQLMVRDFIASARELTAARLSYEAGEFWPIRNIGRHCDFCQFNKACDAALTGGNEQVVIDQQFRRKYGKRAEPAGVR